MASSKNQKVKRPNVLLEIVEEQRNDDLYTITRRPYISSEYIPSGLIPTIMNHHFPSAELVVSYNEKHAIYKIKICDILTEHVKNWENNRPPDMARCPDIARYIYNSRKPVDTMLTLSFNNKKEVFEVLDGIHRLTALKIIKNENSKPLDLMNGAEFGSGNDASWLFNQHLIVNIRFNATRAELIETFESLNKSQAVPEIYIRDELREKRDIVNTIVNEWCVKYKRHFSSADKPNTGYTNRNKFVNLLDKLYDKYNIKDSSSDELRKILENVNVKIQNNIPSKATINQRVACKETGCYLFLYKNEKLEEII